MNTEIGPKVNFELSCEYKDLALYIRKIVMDFLEASGEKYAQQGTSFEKDLEANVKSLEQNEQPEHLVTEGISLSRLMFADEDDPILIIYHNYHRKDYSQFTDENKKLHHSAIMSVKRNLDEAGIEYVLGEGKK